MLKLYGNRSPNISLDLLSSRLALKYSLGAAGASQEQCNLAKNRRWQHVRPLAATVFERCQQGWHGGTEIQRSEARWAQPSVPEWCPGKEQVAEWAKLLQPPKRPAQQKEKRAADKCLVAVACRSLFRFFSLQQNRPNEFAKVSCLVFGVWPCLVLTAYALRSSRSPG